MTSELNLFGNIGFQEPRKTPDEEKIDKVEAKTLESKQDLDLEPKETLPKENKISKDKILKVTKSKQKSKRKRKMKYSGHEVFSFLLASAIIAMVIWFFVLKKTVVSTISEYLPRSFELYQQNSNE